MIGAGYVLKRRDVENLGGADRVSRTYRMKVIQPAHIGVALAESVINFRYHCANSLALEGDPEADRSEPVAKKARLRQQRNRDLRAAIQTGLRKSFARPFRAATSPPFAAMVAIVDREKIEAVA